MGVDGVDRFVVAETNIPADWTEFVGRHDAMNDLETAYERGDRLVTVVGPPGMGKSRLSREFGRRRAADYPGGAWYVPLADARSDDDVITRVGQTLAVMVSDATSTQAAADRILDVLDDSPKRLLILDNAEHLADVVATRACAWLDRVSHLRILATSQRSLGVDRERVVELSPLDPDDAVQLFAHRARRLGRTTEIDVESDTVRSLVHRLDCLPLAVELAAGRSNVLAPSDLLDRIDRRFELLKAGDEVGRHATLANAIAWAWEQLSEDERNILAQCACFRGGFSVDAAEAVIECEGPVLDAIEELVDRSLLFAARDEHGRRLATYESIRDFVHEREHPAERDAAPRHARHYVELGERCVDSFERSSFLDDLPTLRAEYENLAAVAERAELEPSWRVRAAAVIMAMFRTVGPASGAQDAMELIDDVIDRAEPDRAARVYLELGRALLAGHQMSRARDAFERAAHLADEGGALETEVLARRMLGGLAAAGGRLDESSETYEEARAIALDHGDDRLAALVDCYYAFNVLCKSQRVRAGIGRLEAARKTLRGSGDVAGELTAGTYLSAALFSVGRIDEARRLTRAMVEMGREAGIPALLAPALTLSAFQHSTVGAPEAALVDLREAVELADSIGDINWKHQASRETEQVLIDLGRLDEAERLATDNLERFEDAGHDVAAAASACDLGAIALERGEPGRARRWYDRATDHRPPPIVHARTLTERALLEMSTGDLDTARELLAEVVEEYEEQFTGRVERVAALAAQTICLMQLGDRAGAEAVLGRARTKLDERTTPLREALLDIAAGVLGETSSTEFAPNRNWYGRILGRLADATREPDVAEPELVVGPDARWFRRTGREAVDMSRRGPPRLVLDALCHNRIEEGGRPLDVDDLVEVGWPGQSDIDLEAGRRRAYVTIGTLRELGLEDVVLTTDEGYVIDPTIEVRRTSEPGIPPGDD